MDLENETTREVGLADLCLARLSSRDHETRSVLWSHFEGFVLQSEAMYPGIRTWLHTKVAPALGSPHRTAFLLSNKSGPLAAAVLKRDLRAKICHVQVANEVQDQNLGRFFFCLAALEFASVATEVHFTLPESLWNEESAFFSAFGFRHPEISQQQYRSRNCELSCTASFEHFWRAVLEHIPRVISSLGQPSVDQPASLLMSVRPRFARSILDGTKPIEVRRAFSPRWLNQRVSLYATHPDQSLVGEAIVGNIKAAAPEEIWIEFGDRIGCSKQEFDSYSCGATKLYAIALIDVHSYERPFPLSAIRAAAGYRFNPPQSHRKLSINDPVHGAVTLAQVVQTTFPTPIL